MFFPGVGARKTRKRCLPQIASTITASLVAPHRKAIEKSQKPEALESAGDQRLGARGGTFRRAGLYESLACASNAPPGALARLPGTPSCSSSDREFQGGHCSLSPSISGPSLSQDHFFLRVRDRRPSRQT